MDIEFHILSFTGPGNYAVYGAISRAWNQAWNAHGYPEESDEKYFVESSHLAEYAIQCGCNKRALVKMASAVGNIEVVRKYYSWMDDVRDKIWGVDDIHKLAVVNGQINVLDWLLKNRRFSKKHIETSLVFCHDLEVLEWAAKRGLRLNIHIGDSAALNGRLDIVMWAYENKCLNFKTASINAFLSRHYYITLWMFSKKDVRDACIFLTFDMVYLQISSIHLFE